MSGGASRLYGGAAGSGKADRVCAHTRHALCDAPPDAEGCGSASSPHLMRRRIGGRGQSHEPRRDFPLGSCAGRGGGAADAQLHRPSLPARHSREHGKRLSGAVGVSAGRSLAGAFEGRRLSDGRHGAAGGRKGSLGPGADPDFEACRRHGLGGSGAKAGNHRRVRLHGDGADDKRRGLFERCGGKCRRLLPAGAAAAEKQITQVAASEREPLFYAFGEKGLDKYPMGVYSEDTPRGYLEGGCRMEERNCPMCSQRKKERSPEEYKKLINRLSRIEGQIRGIRSMVENGAYCPDILVQSAAANAALNAFNKELLASHLRSCVANDIREGHDEVIDELVVTLQKLMK